MLFRLAAAVMFTAAGVLIGVKRTGELRETRDMSRNIGELLSQCAALLRSQALNVYELAARLKMSDRLCRLSFIADLPTSFELSTDFRTSWRTAVDSQEDIAAEERQILLRFGEILGTTDIEGQLSAIEQLSSESEQLTRRRTEEYLRKGRLFRSIWALFGIMAGILVI